MPTLLHDFLAKCPLSIAVLIIAAMPLMAQEDEKPKAAEAEKPTVLKGFKLQDLDDPAEPLVPKKPRTPEEQNRVDAVSWYMTGQLLEKRNEHSEALDAYKKAVALDPTSSEIIKSLVILAFSQNQTDEAVKYALKAIELDPEDYQILRRLGIHMAQERKVPQAIELLVKALESPKLKENKSAYVLLNRDLAIMYAAIGEKVKAADSYEVVFEALQNPKKFDLNFVQRKSLEANPATMFAQIGRAFIDADRPELAVKAFEAALKARRGKPGVLSYDLAEAYMETEDYDKALEHIQTYFDAQLQVKGREAYELLARILKAQNQTDELIARLEKMAAEDARNTKLQYFLAEQYLEAGQLDKAEAHYKKTLDGGKDPEGFAGLVSVYRRQNKPEELFDSLAEAVEAGSEVVSLAAELEAISQDEKLTERLLEIAEKKAAAESAPLNYGEARIAGKIAAAAKNTESAVKFFQVAMSQRRQASDEIYEEIGGLFLDTDDYAKAAEWYQKAIDDSAVDNKLQFLYRLSQAEEMAGNTDAALAAIKKALAQLPDVSLLHFQEGWIYYHSKRYEDAIKKFQEIESKFKNGGVEDKEIVRRSLSLLSSLYVQQGDLRKGEEVLEKIYAEDPQDPAINNDLGYLYADHGKHLEKAKSMIQIAIKAEPENPAYLDSMGWVLYKLGDYQEALPYLEKAVKLPNGGDATIYDHLGDCYARLKQMDKAQEAWQKALDDAKKQSSPDEKLVKRLEQKLAGAKAGDDVELP